MVVEGHLLLLDYVGLVVPECISSLELMIAVSDHLVLAENDIMLIEGEALELSAGHGFGEDAVIVAAGGRDGGRSSRRHSDAEGWVVFRGALDIGVRRKCSKKRLLFCFKDDEDREITRRMNWIE